MSCIRHLGMSCGVLVLFACDTATSPDDATPAPDFAKGGVAQLVTGSGQVEREWAPGEEIWRTFGFTAQRVGDDVGARGQFEFVDHGKIKRHGVITCYSVDDNAAWLGGYYRNPDDPSVLLPGARGFIVWDNGQGKVAAPDELTGTFVVSKYVNADGETLYPTVEDYCRGQPDGPSEQPRGPWEVKAGNIQIH